MEGRNERDIHDEKIRENCASVTCCTLSNETSQSTLSFTDTLPSLAKSLARGCIAYSALCADGCTGCSLRCRRLFTTDDASSPPNTMATAAHCCGSRGLPFHSTCRGCVVKGEDVALQRWQPKAAHRSLAMAGKVVRPPSGTPGKVSPVPYRPALLAPAACPACGAQRTESRMLKNLRVVVMSVLMREPKCLMV